MGTHFLAELAVLAPPAVRLRHRAQPHPIKKAGCHIRIHQIRGIEVNHRPERLQNDKEAALWAASPSAVRCCPYLTLSVLFRIC